MVDLIIKAGNSIAFQNIMLIIAFALVAGASGTALLLREQRFARLQRDLARAIANEIENRQLLSRASGGIPKRLLSGRVEGRDEK